MSSVDVRPSLRISPGIRRLGIVLGLPLVDGVFVMLVLAGVLDTLPGIILVGTVIFAGGGAIAVILTDLADSPRDYLPGVLLLGAVIVPIAAVQAAIAPVLASAVDEQLLSYVATVLLVLVGIQIGSKHFHRRLPSAGLLVLLGILISVRPNGFSLDGSVDLGLALAGGAAAGIGLGVAIVVLLLGATIHRVIDRDRFRYGGGIALAVLGVSIVTPISPYVPLVILGFAILFALDRDKSDVLEESVESATEQ